MAETTKLKTRHRVGLVLTMVAGVTVFACLIWLADLKTLHEHVETWNGVVVFLMMALLPLVGAPVSFLYVIAGAKYGKWEGLLFAAVAIAIHLVGSYWIAHSFLRKPLDKLFSRTRYRMPQVPQGEHVPVCLLTCLMPGAPYTVKNYLLVLAGTPLRPFFWTGLPAHLFTASVGIFFGDFAGDLTKGRIIFLCCYAACLFVLSRYVVRRLRRRKLNSTLNR